MRRAVAVFVGAAALLAGQHAYAAENWVVPTLQLSGSTSGKGQITAGADFAASRGTTWDIFLSPTFTVANQGGSASILSYASTGTAGPTQFSASFSATFAYKSNQPLSYEDVQVFDRIAATAACVGTQAATQDEQRATLEWLRVSSRGLVYDRRAQSSEAHQALMKAIGERIELRHPGCTLQEGDDRGILQCRCASPTPQCTDEIEKLAEATLTEAAKTCSGGETRGPLCGFLKSHPMAPIARASLCDAGKAALEATGRAKKKLKELRKMLYPQHLIAVGATYGAASFKYLEGSGATLTNSGGTRSSGAAHALYTFVQPAIATRFTFELPLTFDATWKESTKTAYQCSASGALDGKAVQTCSTTPMGAPTQPLQISGAALFGLAGVGESDLWRAAIGPTFMVDAASGAKTQYQIGGQLPLYFSLTKAAGYGQEYEGMVRIMPTVLAEKTSDGKVGAAATLTVSLLGKRKMFGSALYWP